MSEETPCCGWAPVSDKLYRDYHDTEWGVPERDARALWEKLQLDGMQAGLSWITILGSANRSAKSSTGSTRNALPAGRRSGRPRRWRIPVSFAAQRKSTR